MDVSDFGRLGFHLLSIGVSQDVAPHDVDQVGFWVDLTHEATEPPPESEQRKGLF